MAETLVIGVDLGGTNVRAAAVLPDGSIVEGSRVEIPSRAQEGVDFVIDAVASAILDACGSRFDDVTGVGIAIPGIIDDAAGVVRWAPNFGVTIDGVFTYWEDIAFREMLQPKIGRKVVMGNDANLAALGEYKFGSGRDSANCLAMLTIGTGIGGGVVLGNSSLQGATGGPYVLLGGNKGGVELGHILLSRGGLDCNAGSYGALEAYCQRDAVVRRAQHALRRGRTSLVTELVSGDLGSLTPHHLAVAAEQGDALAIQVWNEVGEWLGCAIGALINVFAPDVFAIGGQMSKVGKWLLDPAVSSAQDIAIPALYKDCKIVLAEQIDDAGLLGAASLALSYGI